MVPSHNISSDLLFYMMGVWIKLVKYPYIPPHRLCKYPEFFKKTEDVALLSVKKVLSAQALLARVNGH